MPCDKAELKSWRASSGPLIDEQAHVSRYRSTHALSG